MFSRSITKSVHGHLHDDERLLAAVLAQSAGANTALMLSAVRGPIATAHAHQRADRAQQRAGEAAADAGLAVDRRMVIALTTQRLLIFTSGGAFTVKVKRLLGEAPIAAVDAIDAVLSARARPPGRRATRRALRPPSGRRWWRSSCSPSPQWPAVTTSVTKTGRRPVDGPARHGVERQPRARAHAAMHSPRGARWRCATPTAAGTA